jgi:hypothetical protein
VPHVEETFARMADHLLREPGVDEGTGFGSSPGLRVDSKIFAMLVRGELVLKLPASRCEELVAADAGRPFERGQGRPMREWIVVSDEVEADWLPLAREALAFVRGRVSPSTGRAHARDRSGRRRR